MECQSCKKMMNVNQMCATSTNVHHIKGARGVSLLGRKRIVRIVPTNVNVKAVGAHLFVRVEATDMLRHIVITENEYLKSSGSLLYMHMSGQYSKIQSIL